MPAPIAVPLHVTTDAVLHSDDDGGYTAEVPALPGCYSEGDTLEAATANIREAAVERGDRWRIRNQAVSQRFPVIILTTRPHVPIDRLLSPSLSVGVLTTRLEDFVRRHVVG